jgi:Arc/MetJ-type ribon-helix-helix transcriptional regulator
MYVHVITSILTNITVRIPDELRARMRALSEINWSEVVRRAIEGRIDLEMRRRRDRNSIREAGRRVDAIFEKLRAEHGAIDFDSSGTIRRWRDRRYGAT